MRRNKLSSLDVTYQTFWKREVVIIPFTRMQHISLGRLRIIVCKLDFSNILLRHVEKCWQFKCKWSSRDLSSETYRLFRESQQVLTVIHLQSCIISKNSSWIVTSCHFNTILSCHLLFLVCFFSVGNAHYFEAVTPSNDFFYILPYTL